MVYLNLRKRAGLCAEHQPCAYGCSSLKSCGRREFGSCYRSQDQGKLLCFFYGYMYFSGYGPSIFCTPNRKQRRSWFRSVYARRPGEKVLGDLDLQLLQKLPLEQPTSFLTCMIPSPVLGPYANYTHPFYI